MLKFNILEVINKLIGLAIIAVISRSLAEDFGTFLYYQTFFGYLYAFALFSSDYNFLVNYKISRSYIGTPAYYHTIFIKVSLVIVIFFFSLIFLLPEFSRFAFWPYLLAVCASLFVYDFVLYIEDDKKSIITFRMLSQLATLAGAILFYFHYIDTYYITLIQLIQTSILTFGTFFSAKKYLKNVFNFNAFLSSIKSITFATCFENASYFLLRNFITFFTTIEILILAQKNMVAERDVFAEGMRLSGLLVPFALFYINFNVNKIKKRYYKIITLISIFLLFVSPLYVFLFFGEQFSNKIYYYNFFIAVFAFIAFLEKDYIEFLTRDNSKKKKLLVYNCIYFGLSVLLFVLFLRASFSIETIILVFSAKLIIYYLILIKSFRFPVSYIEILPAFIALPALNYILASADYYNTAFRYLVNLKNHIL